MAQVARELQVRPDMLRVLASDLTYIPPAAGVLYLAVVLDLASRRVVGWAMRPSLAEDVVCAAHGITYSMSRPGNCWHDAVVETFFATLEHELLAIRPFVSHQTARRANFEYIEVWYNRQHRHSTLGYVSPAEFEQRRRAA